MCLCSHLPHSVAPMVSQSSSIVVTTPVQDESLARLALSVFGDIARHSAALAQAVADTGAITRVVALLGSRNVKLRRQVSELSLVVSCQISSMPEAETVVLHAARQPHLRLPCFLPSCTPPFPTQCLLTLPSSFYLLLFSSCPVARPLFVILHAIVLSFSCRTLQRFVLIVFLYDAYPLVVCARCAVVALCLGLRVHISNREALGPSRRGKQLLLFNCHDGRTCLWHSPGYMFRNGDLCSLWSLLLSQVPISYL